MGERHHAGSSPLFLERPLSGWVLVLATSGREAEVGVKPPDERAPLTRRLGAGATRGRDLVPTIAALLEEAGIRPQRLSGVIVDVGPGSFTGVRMGVTAAKTLAFALGIPTAAVNSLEALAVGAAADARVLSLRDAGRGTLYAARYGRGPGGARDVLSAPTRLTASELLGWPASDVARGEDAPRLIEDLGLALRAEEVVADVAALLHLGLARLAQPPSPDPSTLVPLYLQASAPERLLAGEAPPPPPEHAPDRSRAR